MVSIIIAVLVLGLVVLGISFLPNLKKKPKAEVKKDKQVIMRDANRKLAQNPHHPQALRSLADVYFADRVWDKALPLYSLLLDLVPVHNEIDELIVGLHLGICALRTDKLADAFKGLNAARKVDPNHPEVNFYLGQAFYINKEYDKAIALFKKMLILTPGNTEAYRFMGLSLAKGQKPREALPYLKKAMDANPEDKEVLYLMAVCLAESNSIERALKILVHLRPDPQYGIDASLQAGLLHNRTNNFEKAIQDFDIGLKHKDIPPETAMEIRYNMAQSYLKLQKIGEALGLLRHIQGINPNYKDVNALIGQYQELNQNKNLHIYLMANNSDFVTLCKSIVTHYYRNSRAHIINVNSSAEYTEIQATIYINGSEEMDLFRFYRTGSIVGELYLRDFHTKIRDSKADRGICFAAGTYSDEARRFIDGRPVELIDKPELTKLLSRIPAGSMTATQNALVGRA